MPEVEVGGLTIAYEREGHGPPIVLLHGGMSDHREWRLTMPLLSRELTVVAWDAPGCGGSSAPPASFRIDDYADTLAGSIRALGIDRPHVVGLSWGSTLALALAGRHPDLPRSLILTGAYAGWKGSLPPDEVERRVSSTLAELEGPPSAEYVRSFLGTLFTSRASRALLEETAATMAEVRRDGARTMLYAMAEADLRDVLPTIAVPVLMLQGEEDVRSPVDVARELAAAIPDVTLRILPRVGHQSNLEAPDAFAEAVLTFVRSVDA